MTDNQRLHTPSWERMDLPDGFAACLSCGQIMTAEQLLEPCPVNAPRHARNKLAWRERRDA